MQKVLCLVLSATTLCVCLVAFGAEPSSPCSLRDAAAGLFPIGVGISDRIPVRQADWPLLIAKFNAVTPENCLKPDPVQTAEGKFNFTQADALVRFAVSNHLPVVGHCLVWAKDDRTPSWFYRDGANPASRELLSRRMKTHIETVVGRYRGRIAMWDVVNEALDDGPNFLRSSGWSTVCGEEFIAKAFLFAHAADPQALLIYNDYNNELPAKRRKLVRLVQSLRAKNVPIHAIGLQGHYEIDRLPLAEIEATLLEMRKLGMKAVISELDIDVIPAGGGGQTAANIETNSRGSIPTARAAQRRFCNGRPHSMPNSSASSESTPTSSPAFPSGTCTTAKAGSTISPGNESTTRCFLIGPGNQSRRSRR